MIDFTNSKYIMAIAIVLIIFIIVTLIWLIVNTVMIYSNKKKIETAHPAGRSGYRPL